MRWIRLAYVAQFLMALVTVFVLWSEVGGQSHLDLMPWYLKLGLGVSAAFAAVRATIASASNEQAWNGSTLKWVGILLALLTGCGLASYYYHIYGESDEEEQDEGQASLIASEARGSDPKTLFPLSAGRNALQFLVKPRVGQIESVGHSGHRFEADEIASGRSVHHSYLILRTVAHDDLLLLAFHRELRPAILAAHEPGEDIVELHAV